MIIHKMKYLIKELKHRQNIKLSYTNNLINEKYNGKINYKEFKKTLEKSLNEI